MKKNRVVFKTKSYIIESPDTTNPEGLFTLPWNIYSLKEFKAAGETEGEKNIPVIGSFNFEGMQKAGRVNLIWNFDNIQDTGELELIFYYICRWVFSQKFNYSIQTSFPENKQYKQIFDYLPYKKEKLDDTVTFKADEPTNTIIFLFIGLIMGLLFGIMFANIKIGLIVGFVIFGAIGIIKDSDYKRVRNFIENKD